MTRFLVIVCLVFLGLITVVAASFGPIGWLVLATAVVALLVVGVWDVVQTRHSVLRNFPVLGHMRYVLESIRPEIQTSLNATSTVSRSTVMSGHWCTRGPKARTVTKPSARSGMSAKSATNTSSTPPQHPRVRLGGPHCTEPYDISLMSISSMSFGSLSKNAVLAMNKGAALGGFVQETGEGGLTKYHLEYGADLIWEIGSGYFGTRDETGHFSPAEFTSKTARPEVKGISIKLSQGAKPGLGGVLPGPKVTSEIAEARGVAVGVDCVSPASHSAFTTPRELIRFVQQLRELSGGKPIGFKLCVGSRVDVLAICKAMLEEETAPDFIVIDGSEGGTGAAPLEYQDNVGTPLTEGLMLMHNALVGVGLRSQIRLGAAGKVASGSDIVKRLIQGADFTMSARTMMMATGCIQAQKCHTNKCPVGVATQNPRLMRALNVEDKGERVFNYQKLTVDESVQIMASMGCTSPDQLSPRMLRRRVDHLTTRSYANIYNWMEPGELLTGPPRSWTEDWNLANADYFREPPKGTGEDEQKAEAVAGSPKYDQARIPGTEHQPEGQVGRPEGQPGH